MPRRFNATAAARPANEPPTMATCIVTQEAESCLKPSLKKTKTRRRLQTSSSESLAAARAESRRCQPPTASSVSRQPPTARTGLSVGRQGAGGLRVCQPRRAGKSLSAALRVGGLGLRVRLRLSGDTRAGQAPCSVIVTVTVRRSQSRSRVTVTVTVVAGTGSTSSCCNGSAAAGVTVAHQQVAHCVMTRISA